MINYHNIYKLYFPLISKSIRVYDTLRWLIDKMKNFILDVDGVIATGQFLYSSKGKQFKIFGSHDHDGLNLIKDKVNILFISGDKKGFPISKKRIKDMGYKIEFVPSEKRYEYIMENFGFKDTIYMGDGIYDAPIIRDCEFGIAPKNARIEARKSADFVTPSRSGEGAVCDACIRILKMIKKEEREDGELGAVSIAVKIFANLLMFPLVLVLMIWGIITGGGKDEY